MPLGIELGTNGSFDRTTSQDQTIVISSSGMNTQARRTKNNLICLSLKSKNEVEIFVDKRKKIKADGESNGCGG